MAKNGGFGWQNRGRVGAMLTSNELVLTFEGCYLCATFGELDQSRSAIVRVRTDRCDSDKLSS